MDNKYHHKVLADRDYIAVNGGFRDKVRYDLITRPQYACGLLMAADIARFCGVDKITAIEFGVAEGHGLLNLCHIAKMITAETGIAFEILGFDTGEGLPELQDYRNHPEIWSVGDFGGVDKAALEAQLPDNARIIWGDIRDTLASSIITIQSPVGFIANDLDIYSSSMASFALLEASTDKLLPVMISYFDDTLGSPTRIGSLFRNRWCGQLAAIDDFNRKHNTRKIDHLRTLKARRPMDKELWLDQMYGIHVLDHVQRQKGANRAALTIGEHATDDIMHWPI